MSDTVWSTRRLLRQSGLILFLLLICPLLAWACKYSVRDVGFVALDSHSYQLQLIVSSETSETLKEKLHSEYAPLLRDTNIELEVLRENSEILSTSQTEQKPDSGKTAAWLIDTFPASSEESESSFPRRLFLEQVPVEDKATLSAFLWELSDSELREKLIAGTLKAHSVLLIIEGTNTEHNELARKLASQASDQVKSELPDLPKPVEFPPEVITLSVNDRETERILLWSWNIDPEDKDQTYLVPLFGRGRILGEPLAVPGISLTELSTILSYVGQDCECEL
ncbi:MAG: hypothetical protein KDA65_17665, partial [Planctomycetaceae bacterium]|nr:hypothetical protein [Planctomycetaceae bacterium]